MALTTVNDEPTNAPSAKVQAAIGSAFTAGPALGILAAALLKKYVWPDPADDELLKASTSFLQEYGSQIIGAVAGILGGLASAGLAWWKKPNAKEGVTLENHDLPQLPSTGSGLYRNP